MSAASTFHTARGEEDSDFHRNELARSRRPAAKTTSAAPRPVPEPKGTDPKVAYTAPPRPPTGVAADADLRKAPVLALDDLVFEDGGVSVGGMGQVKKAVYRRGTEVAVKELLDRVDMSGYNYFLREIQVYFSIPPCPHIVPVRGSVPVGCPLLHQKKTWHEKGTEKHADVLFLFLDQPSSVELDGNANDHFALKSRMRRNCQQFRILTSTADAGRHTPEQEQPVSAPGDGMVRGWFLARPAPQRIRRVPRRRHHHIRQSVKVRSRYRSRSGPPAPTGLGSSGPQARQHNGETEEHSAEVAHLAMFCRTDSYSAGFPSIMHPRGGRHTCFTIGHILTLCQGARGFHKKCGLRRFSRVQQV